MSNTIATAVREGTESRLIEAVDEVDNTYRLDVGGITILFDRVDLNNSRETFTFYCGERRCAAVESAIIPDRVEGALAVLSRNS